MGVLNRRGFLRFGAAGSVALGLPFVTRSADFADPKAAAILPPPAPPPAPLANWASQFRDEMKKRGVPGVLVILPEASAPGKQDNGNFAEPRQKKIICGPIIHPAAQFASTVHQLLHCCGDGELPQLLCQAVFVAAPADQVRKEFPSMPANAGVALIGVDGKLQATLPYDNELITKFQERVAHLLYGPKGERLVERAADERKALGNEAARRLDAALVDLDHDEFARREAASEVVKEVGGRALAVLALTLRNSPSLEAKNRISAVFQTRLQEANVASLLQASLAPYAQLQPNFDVRVACGQGALKPPAYAFVQMWWMESTGA
jgi:hypothetical protein